ncbi:hypothetical protein [Streptomyces yatensis]|uniref:Uncharacterized protein n=1 Tax=Streptomyces yatensis TaxID=155177 RepID=A0ABP4TJ01_9ACTN|nr:hypothetical protein [Streptomyces yatensis]
MSASLAPPYDTYSSWHPLFVPGPAYARPGELLHCHGLEYRNTDEWVTASVDDGRLTLAHRDPRRTAEGFAHDEDRAAYLAALGRLGENMAAIGGLMSGELRSPAVFRQVAALLRGRGGAVAALGGHQTELSLAPPALLRTACERHPRALAHRRLHPPGAGAGRRLRAHGGHHAHHRGPIRPPAPALTRAPDQRLTPCDRR